MILISCSLFTDLMTFIDKYLATPVKILAVVLFLIFTTLEYSKVVFSADGSSKKANENTLKRFIGLLLLFFTPNIINMILGWVDITFCKI